MPEDVPSFAGADAPQPVGNEASSGCSCETTPDLILLVRFLDTFSLISSLALFALFSSRSHFGRFAP